MRCGNCSRFNCTNLASPDFWRPTTSSIVSSRKSFGTTRCIINSSRSCEEKKNSPVTISSLTEIKNQNWNKEWEGYDSRPVEVSERIVIAPSWHPLPEKTGHIVLVIDPKMSFGTGYHESTRLMLRMMERYVAPKSFVLDVGTGTGILAIAAVKLGAPFCPRHRH